jgi:transposase
MWSYGWIAVSDKNCDVARFGCDAGCRPRRARNLVERFLNKSEQCRRVAASYVKLAVNYFASIHLANQPMAARK